MGAKRRKRRKAHGRHRTTKCPKCGKKFKGKQGIAVHTYRMHKNVKAMDVLHKQSKRVGVVSVLTEDPRLDQEIHAPMIVSVSAERDSVYIKYSTQKIS